MIFIHQLQYRCVQLAAFQPAEPHQDHSLHDDVIITISETEKGAHPRRVRDLPLVIYVQKPWIH